jgi:phage terminase large subunit
MQEASIMALSDIDRKYWQDNPVEWIEKFLGCTLWSKQREIVEAVRDNDKVTVRSGNGVGKSFVASAIALQHLFTHPYSKVLTSAPTMTQVRDILWVEIAKLHGFLSQHIEPSGYLTQVRLKLADGWYAMGRSTDEPQKFIGVHERNLLVIFDEASGIPREMFDASESLLTARGNKLLLIGNPWEPGSYFHETHTGEIPNFTRIHINVLESPNIRKVVENGRVKYEDNLDENGDLPFPDLSSMKWVNHQRDAHGEKSAAWSIKVLGEFPTIATDALFDGRWLAAAVQKGILLRNTIERIDDGSEIYDSATIRRLTGRAI